MRLRNGIGRPVIAGGRLPRRRHFPCLLWLALTTRGVDLEGISHLMPRLLPDHSVGEMPGRQGFCRRHIFSWQPSDPAGVVIGETVTLQADGGAVACFWMEPPSVKPTGPST